MYQPLWDTGSHLSVYPPVPDSGLSIDSGGFVLL